MTQRAIFADIVIDTPLLRHCCATLTLHCRHDAYIRRIRHATITRCRQPLPLPLRRHTPYMSCDQAARAADVIIAIAHIITTTHYTSLRQRLSLSLLRFIVITMPLRYDITPYYYFSTIDGYAIIATLLIRYCHMLRYYYILLPLRHTPYYAITP